MTLQDQKQLGKTLWDIADQLRGAMNADDFRDYMLSFLFLRYLSDNYEEAAKKELGRDYPQVNEEDKHTALGIWYKNNDSIGLFKVTNISRNRVILQNEIEKKELVIRTKDESNIKIFSK